MGFEVVYCYKCQTRLTKDDFQSGVAFRVGVHTTCIKCADELLTNLTSEQRDAVLNPPKPEPPPEESRRNLHPVPAGRRPNPIGRKAPRIIDSF
jgi:hypothetical protein